MEEEPVMADSSETIGNGGTDDPSPVYAARELVARIRTIKPDFWQHPKTGEVSRDARLLFLGLLNEADDEGRMRYSAKRLSGVLFPFDDDATPGMVDLWITALEREKFIVRYEVRGALYLEVCGFKKHQRINRPLPSVLPPRGLSESSLSPHGAISDGARGEVEVEVEVEVEQGEEIRASTPHLVFDAWRLSTGKNGRTVLNAKRLRLIRSALKDYPLEDVLDAVRGWSKSPFHCGQNEARKVWNDIELLLRDGQHIEAFRDLERGEVPTGERFDPAVDLVRRMRAMEARGESKPDRTNHVSGAGRLAAPDQ